MQRNLFRLYSCSMAASMMSVNIFCMFRGSQPIFIFHSSNHNTFRRECPAKNLYFTVGIHNIYSLTVNLLVNITVFSISYALTIHYKMLFCFYFNNLVLKC